MTTRVVGIDIGTTAVRAVEVRDAETDHPLLVRCHEEPLPFGAVSRGEVLEPAVVAAALKRMWASGGFTTKDVVLGMGYHRMVVRNLTVPKMSLRRIRESLPFQVQDLLSFPTAEALLDFYPIAEVDSDGESGPQISGLLIAAMKDVVQSHIKAARLAGLHTVTVDIMSFARSRAISRAVTTPDVIVQIDIGGGSSSVLISSNGVPQFVRVIPSGGNQLTKALRVRLGVDEEAAEVLKKRLGLSDEAAPEDEIAATIIREITSELLESLRNTVAYFTNNRPELPIDRIVLMGGGARLDGFGAALSELTRFPVVPAQPYGGLELGPDVNQADLENSECTFVAALGLALGSKA
ncbi:MULTISPECIES: type IV pilus assembly protein PilM [unclassified Cryobacterium]|uniref:type IV pilus assembly protein PilM n=1 Tax=unclassified Cryobacterium TaxID=2649013 RepID=UPI00106DA186|nr:MULTISPECIES: type IV pilus assembly protein PilM [unclassified Cryobacterium]TFD06677.1 type IV pilus assembly protein PilM [Cryobacterium sp. TMT1-66-1]TFD11256.1 type IV pilus assembly protein PilM [Cryobacterium sp. TMT1-2-2]